MSRQNHSYALRDLMKVGAIVLSTTLEGCATPVPRSLPPDLQPSSFSVTPEARAPVWPEDNWWEGFGDPQLTALIVKARSGNRDLAAAAARVIEAAAQTRIARSALLPDVEGQANFRRGGCRGESCLNYLPGQNLGLTINATYELDFWGMARGNLRVAKEKLKSTRFAQQTVALTLTANVAQQYLNLLSLRRRIAIANDDIAAIGGILEAIDVRVKAGATSGLDRAREEAQIEAVKAQLPVLQTQEREALYSLAVLLGQVPEGFDVQSHDLDAIRAPLVKPGLPADLLLRRPDVAHAEANLAAAHANLDVARAAFLPRISLTGSGGFASTAVRTLLQAGSFGFGYGLNLMQTIFDGGKLFGQKRLADATEREMIASYQSAVLDGYADVESALTEVVNFNDAEDHLRREIAAAQRAFEISQLQFRQGVGDLLAVLQAQQTLFAAEDQLAQVTLANRQAVVHLYEALGGGWLEDPNDRTQIALKLSSSDPRVSRIK
jgi:multidrug efflux system outer membrane protein